VQGGLGPRFALEAGFLIAVAIGAGVAQLGATAIVAVMAAAWLLVCLFELAVWAEGPRFPSFVRQRVLMEEHSKDQEPEPQAVEPEPVAAAAEAQRHGEGG
jgi:hypothetical protein